MPTYTLIDLARLAGVTPRTVRFYVQQGLLPSPGQQGPATRYTDHHLERLRLIRKLQAAHLPLAEIRAQLRSIPSNQLARLAQASAPAPSSAADYIRGVLQGPAAAPQTAAPSAAAPPAAASMPAPSQPASPTPPVAPETMRSQWERILFDPDVELHVRRPLTRTANKRVERLITIARQLFEEA